MNPRPTAQLAWRDYFQSVRKIVARHSPNHGNYRIHDHEFVEICLITGGTCFHQSVAGDSRATTGDVFLFRPGAWHGIFEARGLSLFICCFGTDLLGRELSWMADDPLLGQLLWGIPLSVKQGGMVSLHLPPPAYEQCRKLLDQLEGAGKEDYLSHHGDHLGMLVQILSLLARNLASPAKSKSANAHRAVAAALKLIDEAPTEAWTLKSLAARVNVESTYFVRLFRSVVGLPPMAYITRRRLELATNLLRRAELSVGEVGAMSGWEDANYFSRCFRSHFGMTPSRYRARFGKNA